MALTDSLHQPLVGSMFRCREDGNQVGMQEAPFTQLAKDAFSRGSVVVAEEPLDIPQAV